MRTTDLEHRLNVLYAWKRWGVESKPDDPAGATYRAVLDGCGITVRALCEALGITANFKGKFDNESFKKPSPARTQALFDRCNDKGKAIIGRLPSDEERCCLLEVLFFASRPVAHFKDGDIDHHVGDKEIRSAILTVKRFLQTTTDSEIKAALVGVNPEFLKP